MFFTLILTNGYGLAVVFNAEGLSDNQNSLQDLAPSTQAGTMAVYFSLFKFGHEVGYLTFNVGRGINTPKVRSRISQQMLPEADILRMNHSGDASDNFPVLASQKRGNKPGRLPSSMTEKAILNVIRRSAHRSGPNCHGDTWTHQHCNSFDVYKCSA